MKRLIFTAVVGSLLALSASALTLTVSPGKLKSELTLLKNTKDTRLELNGSADATDLILLKELSRTVSDLDMSGLKIMAYKFSNGSYAGITEFSADEIPPFMLAGTSVSNLVLPDGIRIIGESALANSNLVEFNVPKTVTQIKSQAFANNRKLVKVSIKKDAVMGNAIFKDCENLTAVVFDYPVAAIPDAMFDGCGSYNQSLPSSVEEIGKYAYRGTALSHLNLSSVKSIGDYAFADMPDLETIVMPVNNDVRLGTGIFFNDSGLENLPLMVFSAPKLVLGHASGRLTSVIKAQEIGEAAYANNADIDTLTLGDAVSKIHPHAFRNLSSLDMVDAELLDSRLPEVDKESFSGLLNSEGRYDINLNVKRGTEDIWKAHPIWGLFNVGHFATGVDDIESVDSDIEIRRYGSSVEIESSEDIQSIDIYDINGMVLYHGSAEAGRTVVQDMPENSVIVVVARTVGVTKTVKLR